MEETFGFGEAMDRLEQGKKVRRKGWDDSKKHLQMVGTESDRTIMLYAENPNDHRVVPAHWTGFVPDMVSDDWCEA